MLSIYEQSMQLQALLDNCPEIDETKSLIRDIGLEEINNRWHGSVVRAAHASDAYHINDGLTLESNIFPVQKFGEIVLKGNVPKVDCIEIKGRSIVTLPFFDAVVLGPRQEIELSLVGHELADYDTVLKLDVHMRRPIHTPVESPQFITFAV